MLHYIVNVPNNPALHRQPRSLPRAPNRIVHREWRDVISTIESITASSIHYPESESRARLIIFFYYVNNYYTSVDYFNKKCGFINLVARIRKQGPWYISTDNETPYVRKSTNKEGIAPWNVAGAAFRDRQ